MNDTLLNDALWFFKNVFQLEVYENLIETLATSSRIAFMVRSLAAHDINVQYAALQCCANMLVSEDPKTVSQAIFEGILPNLCELTKNPLMRDGTTSETTLMKEICFCFYNIIGDCSYSLSRFLGED
jgi:hypothetical protein